MPRKLRSAKARYTDLSPAVAHFLMTGRLADQRIHGWVNLAQVRDRDFTAFVAAAWMQHQATLIAEAAAGFVPWGATHTAPRGPAVQRWSRDYCAQHTY